MDEDVTGSGPKIVSINLVWGAVQSDRQGLFEPEQRVKILLGGSGQLKNQLKLAFIVHLFRLADAFQTLVCKGQMVFQ